MGSLTASLGNSALRGGGKSGVFTGLHQDRPKSTILPRDTPEKELSPDLL